MCFHALTKFDGRAFGPMKAREYWQMAGRAGRQGIDDKGWVFALFDETEIDHRLLEYLQSGLTEPVNMTSRKALSCFRFTTPSWPT